VGASTQSKRRSTVKADHVGVLAALEIVAQNLIRYRQMKFAIS